MDHHFPFISFLTKGYYRHKFKQLLPKSFYKLMLYIFTQHNCLSFAFSYRDISDKILRKQDISYGIYIYHMLIINIFIQYNIPIKPTPHLALFY